MGREELAEVGGPFAEVANLAFASQDKNRMGILPFELRIGENAGSESAGVSTCVGLAVVVQSSLISHGNRGKSYSQVEGGQMVHYGEHPSMTAEATLVGLFPNGNSGRGEAALYNTEVTFTPASERRAASFQDTVVSVIKNTVQGSEVLDTQGNVLHGEGVILAQHPNAILLGTEDTQLTVEVVGRQELDREVGVRGALRGPMAVQLHQLSLVRVTADAIYNSQAGSFRVALPPATSLMTKLVMLPQVESGNYAQSLSLTTDGKVIVTGQEKKAQPQDLNPTMPLSQVLPLITEPLEWQNPSEKPFTEDNYRKQEVAHLLNFGLGSHRLKALFKQAESALRASRESTPLKAQITGCLLVAAALRSLPHQPNDQSIGLRYFND